MLQCFITCLARSVRWLSLSRSSCMLPLSFPRYRFTTTSATVTATHPPPELQLQSSDADHYYMGLALDQALQAYTKREVPVGAILLGPDKKVYAGHNTVECCHDVTCHAELNAIKSAMHATRAWRLEGCTLYSTLEPCPMCLSAAALARVARLVYAAKEPRLGAVESWLRLPDLQHPFHRFEDVKGGVREEEAAKLLKGFFRERRLASSPVPMMEDRDSGL